MCLFFGCKNLFVPSAGTAPGNFDVVIPNRVLKQAYAELRDFVVKELQAQRDQGVNVSMRQVVPADE